MTSYVKSFAKPDETRPFKGHGHLEVLQFDDRCTIGKGVFEPGWKWSNDVQPIAGTASCQNAHAGCCISGRMTIRMDNGDEFTVGPGDAFHLPAGHDAWTVGEEPCVLNDTTGVKAYARPKYLRPREGDPGRVGAPPAAALESAKPSMKPAMSGTDS